MGGDVNQCEPFLPVLPFGGGSALLLTTIDLGISDTGNEAGSVPGAQLLSLPDRISQRRLHHRARHLVSAHLEDGADEALDAQPRVPEAVIVGADGERTIAQRARPWYQRGPLIGTHGVTA